MRTGITNVLVHRWPLAAALAVSLHLLVVGVAIAAAWVIAVVAVVSALSAVYKTALYRWATKLPVDPAFDASDLSGAFRRR